MSEDKIVSIDELRRRAAVRSGAAAERGGAGAEADPEADSGVDPGSDPGTDSRTDSGTDLGTGPASRRAGSRRGPRPGGDAERGEISGSGSGSGSAELRSAADLERTVRELRDELGDLPDIRREKIIEAKIRISQGYYTGERIADGLLGALLGHPPDGPGTAAGDAGRASDGSALRPEDTDDEGPAGAEAVDDRRG